MSKHLLSKSSFIRGQQCPKALFLFRYYPQLRDPLPPERQAIFSRGHHVGKLARDLFPGGVDLTPRRPATTADAVIRTQELIAGGATVLYEAAFLYNDVLVLVDLLVKNGDRWKAYEVKSSSRVTAVYIQDAALQYYVIAGTGLPLEDFVIVYVDTEYRRHGPVELKKLFRFRSVLNEVQREHPKISAKVGQLKHSLEATQVPDISIGEHCYQPYPCDFMGNCWKHVPEGTVFELSGLSRAEQFSLFKAGMHRPAEIPDHVELPAVVKLQRESLKAGGVLADKEKLRAFAESLNFPLSFLDMESFMPAVPLFEDTHPYQHLPFEYSLHRIAEPGAEPEHLFFLAEPGDDPRAAFLAQLLRDTEGEGSLLVYDVTFERNIMNALKRDFPEHAAAIDQRLARLRDLMEPFMQRWYYHHSMKGSVSLKNVLPALVPGMSYDTLKIASGSHAMSIYEQLLGETDLFRIAEQKEALLEYGTMDTLAMVKIWEVLVKASL